MALSLLKRLPLATAFAAGLKNYSFATFRADATAGLIVSLVALPLAMALAIAVGLPPQHGLYTAVVAGVAAALLGGSMTQVSGPTAAFVVIVAPIVAQYGLHGIIWCQILAGLMLLALGIARLGRLIHYVPYPVVTGFTAGIAVTIAMIALNDFFGLGLSQTTGHFMEKAAAVVAHLPALKEADTAVGAVTLLTIFLLPRFTAKIPASAAGIALGTLLSWFLASRGMPVDTLLTKFSYTAPGGAMGAGIPPYPPTLHLPGGEGILRIPDYAEFNTLFMPAAVIAALAALESLLSATVADSMARTRHDPDAELNGIGVANILSGLAAGIPATGAIARTAANIQSGARTPVASAIHALLILLYMVTLAPWISHIPMAALAALLISVAWRMSHAKQCITILRLAPRGDVVVLLACFFLTVFIDMVAGVTVGMIMACLLFMKRAGDTTRLHIESHAPGTLLYRIEGPLFFGSIAKTLQGADTISPDVKKLVIDLSHVPLIDMTGMLGMKTFLATATLQPREVLLCGPEDITGRIMQKIAGSPGATQVHAQTALPV